MKKIVLECNNLYKKNGMKEIIKNVSLKLYEGDILGFIGSNGAGKTTTMKLILGMDNITSGNVKINGYDIKKDFINAIAHVGAIVENPDFYMYMSGRKNLELSSNMYKDIKKERIDEVVKLVGLENRINDKVSKYSLGMRQRLGIAEILLNKPNLLLLDEPTNGLDPEGIKELKDILTNLSKNGVTIFISSHMLSLLDNFCTKICIIKNGKLVETKELKNLKQFDNEKYVIETSDTTLLSTMDVKILNNNFFEVECKYKGIPKIIEYLVNNKIPIYSVVKSSITLEDAFLLKTGGNTID